MELQNLIQNIDYIRHPAFSGISITQKYDDAEISRIISKLDGLYIDARDLKKDSSQDTKNLYSELEKITLKFITDENFEISIKKIISLAEKRSLQHINYFLNQSKYESKKLTESESTVLEDLKQNGFCKIEINSKDKQEIKTLGEKLLNESRTSYKDRLTWRGAKSLTLLSESGFFFNNFLRRNNFQKIISEYKKNNMTLCYMGLDYAHERQTWFKDCYKDVGLELPKTNYYHFDDDLNVVKMMIYLSDVKEKNGPFHVLTGYNYYDLSPTRWCLASSLDHGLAKSLKNQTLPFDYYRPIFKDHRDLFINLPKAFQITTHFGDDIVPNSEAEKIFIKNSIPFIEEAGTTLIFDGQRVIHKGSTCEQGERLGLQIGFIEAKFFNREETIKKYFKSNPPFNSIARGIKKIFNDKLS